MFDFLTSKVLMWVCAGLAGALLLTGAFAGCEHHNAKEARAERDAMKSERDSARTDRDQVVKANESQQVTIDLQDRALNQWASIGVTPTELAEILKAMRARNAELELQLAAAQKEKEKDDASPDCQQFRQADFQRVCPNRARVLRGYESRLSR